MPERHVIEIVLDEASTRKARKIAEETLGGKFWKESFSTAHGQLKNYLKDVAKLGDYAADRMAGQFSDMFGKAAGTFGTEVGKAAKQGSAAYVQSMKTAIDKISRLENVHGQERLDMVGKIIQAELSGLDERLGAEKKLAKEREKMAKASARKAPGAPGAPGRPGLADMGQFGRRGAAAAERVSAAGKTVKGMGAAVGGRAGAAMTAAGGAAVTAAGAVGGIVAVIGALGLLAKTAHKIQKQVKDLNRQMMQTVSASDMVGSGFLSVTEGVTALRQEFMAGARANYKWRMTAQQGYETINALALAGVRLDAVLTDTGDRFGDVQRGAREASDTIMTYSKLFGASTGEIGNVIGSMMINLSYSFDETREALAAIEERAKMSGIATGTFFSKVQQVNSQLGLMNTNLKGQAKLLADVTREGMLGFEDAAESASRLMGKITFDLGATLSAYVGEGEMAKAIRGEIDFMERAVEKLREEGADPKMIARFELAIEEGKQALMGGVGEMADFFASGLATESMNFEARMRGVAQALGKSFEELSAEDIGALNLDDAKLLEALAFLGGDREEITKGLVTIKAAIEANGGTVEAVESMREELLREGFDEAISEDLRMAQEQAQNTEDVATILTNMKEWMFSTLYDILLSIYDVLVGEWGTDQQQTLLGFDRALRQNAADQERIAREMSAEGDPARRIELAEQLLAAQEEQTAIEARRGELGAMTEEELEREIAKYGRRATMETLLEAELGGTKGTGRGGTLTGGATAAAPRSTGSLGHTTRAEHLGGYAVAAQGRQEAALEFLKAKGYGARGGDYHGMPAYELYELLKADADSFVPDYESRYGSGAANITAANLIEYVKEYEDYYRDRLGAGWFTDIPLAEGGIVTRPTRALIGEAGPEAVIPLGRGGRAGGDLHVHFYGGVWNEEELKRKLRDAFSQWERSQRV